MGGGKREAAAVAELERAAFVISIDTEMAWGLNHRPHLTYRYDAEREHLRRLIDLFDRYEIPATWAVVGHLLLDSCDEIGGVKHPEIVRPDYEWFDGDWFADDPCADATSAPTWYAPQLLELLDSARTPQELASHGFSHMIAGDPGCSREAYCSEIEAAVAVAESRGRILRSFIHPRNRLGHNDVLAEHGFIAFRGKRPPPVRKPSPQERVGDVIRGSERTTVRPIRESGMWNFPATTMFTVDARPRTWRLWIRQVERRLDQAVERRALFHLWFHPHNLRDRPEPSFAALERICRAAANHRERGVLDTLTMGDLAEQLSGRLSVGSK